MDTKILEDKKQPLFSRRVISAEIDFGEGKTPSRADVRNEIARAVKAEGKLVSVRKIATEYGYRRAKVEAYVYASEAELAKGEPKHILSRHEPKKAKEEGAAEEKKKE
jgi:ribosomal protein S24E